MTAGIFFAAVLMAAAGGGCGGGARCAVNAETRNELEAKAREAAKLEENRETAEAQKRWGATHPTKPPPPPPPPPRATMPGGAAGGSAARAGKSARPGDVAQWTPDDFRAAQHDDDPRLIEAVAYAGKHFATEESAELLAKLLGPPPVDSGSRQLPQRVKTSPALIDAVVAALLANGTATARQILERLVAGTQETIDPQLAAAAALKALLQHAGQNNEDLVFRVITSPEPPAKTGRSAIDRDKLRSMSLEWVKASASEALRLRLANSMIAARTPPAVCKQIWTTLSDARVENLAAQIVLYRSGRLSSRDEELLERLFTAQSRRELRRLLGCVPPEQPRLASRCADPPTVSCRAAELLWAPGFAELVEKRLHAAEGTDRGWRLLPLACTIPSSAMRATVLKLMEQYWEEGPKRVERVCRLRRVAAGARLPPAGKAIAAKRRPCGAGQSGRGRSRRLAAAAAVESGQNGGRTAGP